MPFITLNLYLGFFPKDSGTDVPILQGRLQHQTYQQPSPVRQTRHRGSDQQESL